MAKYNKYYIICGNDIILTTNDYCEAIKKTNENKNYKIMVMR